MLTIDRITEERAREIIGGDLPPAQDVFLAHCEHHTGPGMLFGFASMLMQMQADGSVREVDASTMCSEMVAQIEQKRTDVMLAGYAAAARCRCADEYALRHGSMVANAPVEPISRN